MMGDSFIIQYCEKLSPLNFQKTLSFLLTLFSIKGIQTIFIQFFFERKVDEYKHFSNFIYIFLIYKTS